MPTLPKKPLFNLEELLSNMNAPVGPMAPVTTDPNTGQQMVGVPENKKEEQALANAIGPGQGQPRTAAVLPGMPTMQMPRSAYDDPEFKELYKWGREKVKQQIMREQQGIDQMEQQLQGYEKTPADINWKPLAGYVSTMITGGDKFLAGIPEAETPQARSERITKLQNLIEQRRQGVGDQALKLLQQEINKKSGEDSSRLYRQNLRQTFQAEKDMQTDLEKNVFQPMGRFEEQMGTMERLIAKGDLMSLGEAVSTFARAVAGEKGVLTDNDISRIYPSTLEGSLAKAASWLTSNPNQPMPPAIMAGLQDAIRIARDNAAGVFDRQIKTKEALYSARTVSNLMGEGGYGKPALDQAKERAKAFKAGGPTPAADGLDMSKIDEQIKAKGIK